MTIILLWKHHSDTQQKLKPLFLFLFSTLSSIEEASPLQLILYSIDESPTVLHSLITTEENQLNETHHRHETPITNLQKPSNDQAFCIHTHQSSLNSPSFKKLIVIREEREREKVSQSKASLNFLICSVKSLIDFNC